MVFTLPYLPTLLNIVRTGGGKSLCFHLPSVLQPDQLVFVISPITALVREQVLKMLDLGINAALLGNETNADVLKMDSVQILYCNPESLFVGPNVQKSKNMENLFARHETGEKKISLVAIDEAYKVFEWGSFGVAFKVMKIKEYFPSLAYCNDDETDAR